ncbi:hypothetical protein [Actinoplanes sp. NPDC049599]|uniref:hypothetical protein n=1 Tax=Actinoplanes sp. NPDC049599 TaxID=3363903 RepID=UPI00378ABA9D
MAMTSAAEINATLIRYEQRLAALRRQVIGDVDALDRAGVVAADCAARVTGAAGELTAARGELAASWAAPSGEAFQTRSEPLPAGIAATGRLLTSLATGLRELGLILKQTQDRVGAVGREFAAWASRTRTLLPQGVPIPDPVLQEVDRAGAAYVEVAEAVARRLDLALEQFSAGTEPLVRELAAAPRVTP